MFSQSFNTLHKKQQKVRLNLIVSRYQSVEIKPGSNPYYFGESHFILEKENVIKCLLVCYDNLDISHCSSGY